MNIMTYCLQCRRIFQGDVACPYCNSTFTKELSKNSPVNVMGSKIKGKVLKVENGKARLLIIDENNEKHIREYEAEKLRKIL